MESDEGWDCFYCIPRGPDVATLVRWRLHEVE